MTLYHIFDPLPTLKNKCVVFYFRAAAYIKIQKFDQARDDCKAALSLNPSYARAYGRLG